VKRRLSFATPFVLTIACGGSQRDPNAVIDPAPMHDIAQPDYELAPDALVDAPSDAPLDAPPSPTRVLPSPPTAPPIPLCFVSGNPPGREPCKARRILKTETIGAKTRIMFIGGTDEGMRTGQRVVLATTTVESTIERCDKRTCTATLAATADQIQSAASVYVEADR
jgi:hypothetical protein